MGWLEVLGGLGALATAAFGFWKIMQWKKLARLQLEKDIDETSKRMAREAESIRGRIPDLDDRDRDRWLYGRPGPDGDF